MKSVLEEIYFNNEGLYEKVDEGEEYDRLNRDYYKVHDKLLEGLNDEQKKMLDELFLLSGGMESEARLALFKEGFRFCMRLIFEGISK